MVIPFRSTPMSSNFDSTALRAYMQSCQDRVELALTHALPGDRIHPASLHTAMRYSTLNGGKRVRPVLVYAAGQAVGVAPAALDAAAAALECIHVYSLIHDDLPAMDDDDLRRGKPTCHKVYGEAEAILAGDALQTLAFELLAKAPLHGISAETRLRMIEMLARAAGSRGMVGGQSIDLASTGQLLDIAALEDMHIHKTGALIRASVVLGALQAPQIQDEQLERLDHYAKCIGLSFQIQDDILDVEGDTETLGKQAGADQAHAKATYPALLGLPGARERARELTDEAISSLSDFDDAADPLRWLAEYIVTRTH